MIRHTAVIVVLLALVGPAWGGLVYDSVGFEGFNTGALVGQTAGDPAMTWEDINPPNGNRFSVQSAITNGGSRAVAATGSSDTPAFVAPNVNYAPLPGEIVVVEVDIARTISRAPIEPSSGGFYLDIYPSTAAIAGGQIADPQRIAEFGLRVNQQNDGIEAYASTFDGTPQGMELLIPIDVTSGAFISFRAELDYATETYRVFANGFDSGVLGFINPASTYSLMNPPALDLGDADLSHNPVLGATDVGYFDNYRIYTVPEPGTLGAGLLIFAGMMLRRRR